MKTGYVIKALGLFSLVLAVLSCEKEMERYDEVVLDPITIGQSMESALFEIEDLFKTSVCPLARVMRTECRKRGVKKLKVVYSREEAVKPDPALVAALGEQSDVRRSIPASSAFVPSVAGLIIASEVVKDLIR